MELFLVGSVYRQDRSWNKTDKSKIDKSKMFFFFLKAKGYPQRMIQMTVRNYYYSIVLCDCKLESISCKSLNKPLRDYCQGTIINLTLKSSYFKSAKSSLQSQPLWLTMYFEFGFSWQFNLNFLIMIYFICVYLRKKT